MTTLAFADVVRAFVQARDGNRSAIGKRFDLPWSVIDAWAFGLKVPHEAIRERVITWIREQP